MLIVTTLLGIGCARPTTVSRLDPRLDGAAPGSELYRTIAKQDSLMQDAYNRHDAKALLALFSDDLEFYHDNGGLARKEDIGKGFADLFSRNDGIRRELVPGTLRVFPVKDYGAMELGAHRFCHMENGKQDCGTFEFVQIWKRTGDRWQITRVVSYGH